MTVPVPTSSASSMRHVVRSSGSAWRAWAATSGAASRASIDSRPWIVDSAPLLRLIVPSRATPSNVRPGRRVVHRRLGRVVAEVPRGRDARQPRSPAGAVDGQQALQPRVGAVGDLHAVGRRRVPAVLRPGGDQQVRRERAACRRPPRRGARSPTSAAGICEPHACQIERDSAHGSTAPYGQVVARGVVAERRDALAEACCQRARRGGAACRRRRGRASPRRSRRRRRRSATPARACRRRSASGRTCASTSRSSASIARSIRSARKRANAGSSRLKAR